MDVHCTIRITKFEWLSLFASLFISPRQDDDVEECRTIHRAQSCQLNNNQQHGRTLYHSNYKNLSSLKEGIGFHSINY